DPYEDLEIAVAVDGVGRVLGVEPGLDTAVGFGSQAAGGGLAGQGEHEGGEPEPGQAGERAHAQTSLAWWVERRSTGGAPDRSPAIVPPSQGGRPLPPAAAPRPIIRAMPNESRPEREHDHGLAVETAR